MKIIAGAFFLAFSNKSRARLAPTPTTGSYQKHAFGNFGTKGTEFFWGLQKLNYFLKLLFSFINTGYIGKLNRGFIFVEHFSSRTSKREQTVAWPTSLAEKEIKNTYQEDY